MDLGNGVMLRMMNFYKITFVLMGLYLRAGLIRVDTNVHWIA